MNIEGGCVKPLARLIEYPRHGGTNQQFRVILLPDGALKIVSVKSGLVLDVHSASVCEGAQVIQYPFHGGIIRGFFLRNKKIIGLFVKGGMELLLELQIGF